MSLNREMEATVHSLATAASARRQALEHICAEARQHLAEARTGRHRMMAEQLAARSEALRRSHLATGMVLGNANELIDSYCRQRKARTAELQRTLTDGAKLLRVRTRKWLSMEAALRRKLATQSCRERLADRAALRNTVAAASTRHLEFMGSLTKDRCAAAGTWRSHPAAGSASVPAAPTEEAHIRSARQKTEARAVAKREADARAAAKREAEATRAPEATEGSHPTTS